ncbi:hypothetical protein [Methylocella sp. CPCC 101449]|uniref:hypothetical protein n=1 Tax=Methylocella sp. CPCC 101449 TaxID=2987531 RepID=UPI0028916B1F|nr:hypothetical protein [Methylocella sp. CPCC 101449]MDT2024529.1 hypothetical protein [Methylocella sp. CPCC 101449]
MSNVIDPQSRPRRSPDKLGRLFMQWRLAIRSRAVAQAAWNKVEDLMIEHRKKKPKPEAFQDPIEATNALNAWDAEHQKLIAAISPKETEAAYVAADDRCSAIERAISGVKATDLDGVRLKLTVLASQYGQQSKARAKWAREIDRDGGGCPYIAIETSLLLDLADWSALA